MLVFLMGASGVAPSLIDDVLAWVGDALDGMTGETTKFEWNALIGTTGSHWFAEPFRLGDLSIEPSTVALREWVSSTDFRRCGASTASQRTFSRSRARCWATNGLT